MFFLRFSYTGGTIAPDAASSSRIRAAGTSRTSIPVSSAASALAAAAWPVAMRSSCPPLLFGCRFLNFSRSRCELDLAARRAIARLEACEEPTDEMIGPYLEYGSPKYLAMVEEIRKGLNLNTLKFQKLEKLIEAIGVDRSKVCTYCWTGRDVDRDKIDRDKME